MKGEGHGEGLESNGEKVERLIKLVMLMMLREGVVREM